MYLSSTGKTCFSSSPNTQSLSSPSFSHAHSRSLLVSFPISLSLSFPFPSFSVCLSPSLPLSLSLPLSSSLSTVPLRRRVWETTGVESSSSSGLFSERNEAGRGRGTRVLLDFEEMDDLGVKQPQTRPISWVSASRPTCARAWGGVQNEKD